MRTIIISSLTIFILSSCSAFEDSSLTRIKNSSFDACSNFTIENRVNNCFSNPKWEAIKADNGMDYVNLYGGITFMEKPVDAAVQFSGLSLYELMNPSEVVSVSIVAFELNEIPQNQMMISGLVLAMCEA
tara:strand:+ start:569 stop:958 length:390 start_codon:yes stop_codon:yes gene_type:complete